MNPPKQSDKTKKDEHVCLNNLWNDINDIIISDNEESWRMNPPKQSDKTKKDEHVSLKNF